MGAATTIRRLIGAVLIAVAVVGISAPAANADDTTTTSTGQTLSIRACADGDAATATRPAGIAKISPGRARIEAVFVRINDGEIEWVALDDTGHFRAERFFATDWSDMRISATVRASDGTTATSGCTLTRPGQIVVEAHSPGLLPETGLSGARTLGPIGLLMLATGGSLVQWSRRSRITSGNGPA